MPYSLNKQALCDCPVPPRSPSLGRAEEQPGQGKLIWFKTFSHCVFPVLLQATQLSSRFHVWEFTPVSMHALVHGLHGQEQGWEVKQGPPLEVHHSCLVLARNITTCSQCGNCQEGCTQTTYLGRHRDKGQPGVTSIPEGFLNFHRPKNPSAHKAVLRIPKGSPLSH